MSATALGLLAAAWAVGASGGVGRVDDEVVLAAIPWLGLQGEGAAIAIQGPLRFDTERGGLREADWDETADYGRILRFATLESDDDAARARIGVLSDRTLGHGTLVRRFHNSVDDDHPRTGAALWFEGDRGGLHGFVDHLLGPPLVAARGHAELADRLDVGLTFVGDGDGPPTSRDTGDERAGEPGDEPLDEVAVLFGVDVDMAVWRGRRGAGVSIYGDANRVGASDPGLHGGVHVDVPIGRRWRLRTRLEAMRLGRGYDWAWVDTSYLVHRRLGRAAATPALQPAAGGRLAVEFAGPSDLEFGASYADADTGRRADLLVWGHVAHREWDVSGVYQRRHPDARWRVLDPGDALAAIAGRVRLTDALWVGLSLGRAWRDRGGPRTAVTEGLLTFEAVGSSLL